MPVTWLLDVDGVINASRPGWSRPPRAAMAYAYGHSYRLRWEPRLLERADALAGLGVNVRWSTTWCSHVAELRRVFGVAWPSALPAERPAHLTWDELKVDAVRDALGRGDRVVWTDDSVVPAALEMFADLREAVGDGRLLAIAPKPSRGLRPDDLDAIEAYARQEEILPEGLPS